MLDALPPSAEALQHQFAWAHWQAARLTALNTQMTDRKWTDKARCLLMAARSLDEPAAFRLLRDAAMFSQMNLGEVSRAVERAATLAEAVNLAGQQRMLSQRVVKLLAQRAAAIEPRRAKARQDKSCARVETNLAHLQQMADVHGAAATLALTQRAWLALQPLLSGKKAPRSAAPQSALCRPKCATNGGGCCAACTMCKRPKPQPGWRAAARFC